MMRRTTLGPVSSSGMNSRLSIGGNAMRQSAFPGKDDRRMSSIPAPGGRLSAGPNRRGSVASNRQSIRASGISGGRPGSKSDPRPVSDRAYMQQCIRNLICFLSEHGFDQAISPKLLSTPTSKDFQHILWFLVRQIDPSFTFEKRFEDEVPLLLKTLRYPFTISKTALHAVGSPHTWPALLAALSWILELLQYDEAARNATSAQAVVADSDGSSAESEFGKELFFQYVSKTYDAFLGGDDEFEDLEAELSATFEQRDADTAEKVQSLEKNIETMRFELKELKCQESPVIELTKRKGQYEQDIEKFTKLLDKLRSHNKMLQQKLDEKRAELAARQTEREAAIVEKTDLKVVIATQEAHAIDAQRIASDRASLKLSMQSAAEARELAEQKHTEAESRISQATRKLEEQLSVYHAQAERLQLVPATARNARGMQFRIQLTRNASATRAEQMLSVGDVREEVVPAIQELKAMFSEEIEKALGERLRLQERRDDMEEQLVLKRDELSGMETKAQRLEMAYKEEREGLGEQLQRSAKEEAAVVEHIQQMKRENDDKLKQSQRDLENLREEYRVKKDSFQLERQTVNDSLYETMDMLTSHKSHIQEVIDVVRNKADDVYLEILNSTTGQTQREG